MMKAVDKYKIIIAKHLSSEPERIFLYWKGRVALYALLKAAGIGPGDEVILSGLTCVVVPNAIKYLGAKPVYLDVNPETYNPSFQSYREAISSRTRVLIIQNTFGLSSDVDKIAELARKEGLITIEDCTHGFGGTFRNKPNGSYCDAAIYSTQWNKPYSTGIGGFCVINNRDLLDKIRSINEMLIKPGLKESMILSLLIWSRKTLITNQTYWFLRKIYRKLSATGIVIGSSQGEELQSPVIPNGFFKAVSMVQIRNGLKSIRRLDNMLLKRKECGIAYSDFLKSNNKKFVSEKFWDDHSFLVYPILVKDREGFNKMAEIGQIRTGDWFVSPLHPIKSNFFIWDLDEKNVPNASFLSKHLVNLPTTEKDIKGVLGFLRENIDSIL
jgi:perosamine synthetase